MACGLLRSSPAHLCLPPSPASCSSLLPLRAHTPRSSHSGCTDYGDTEVRPCRCSAQSLPVSSRRTQSRITGPAPALPRPTQLLPLSPPLALWPQQPQAPYSFSIIPTRRSFTYPFPESPVSDTSWLLLHFRQVLSQIKPYEKDLHPTDYKIPTSVPCSGTPRPCPALVCGNAFDHECLLYNLY